MIETISKNNVPAPSTQSDTLFFALKEDIATGKIPPGTHLSHRKLAKQFGTSNTPVIAALRQLEGVGLLVTRPGEGTQVRRWDPKQYEETFLVRAALESIASRFFAMRATAEEMHQLDELNDAYDSACEAGDWEASIMADRNLHLHIVHASRAEEVIRMVDNASLILLTIRTTMLPPELSRVGFPGEHAPLVEALKSRDPDKAEEEGRKHLMESPVLTTLRRTLTEAEKYHRAEMSTSGFRAPLGSEDTGSHQ